MEKYIVHELDANQRVDKYLRKVLKDIDINTIFKCFRKKDIKVNNKRVTQNYILQANDEIVIYIDKNNKIESPFKVVEMEFSIIYEDDNILIVSKPIGVSVQEDNSSHGQSLANQVLSYLYLQKKYNPKTDITFKPSPLHRIDRNTSGLVIFAKNFATSQELNLMLKQRTNIEKYYLAIVKGVTPASGRIDLPLEKEQEGNIVKVSFEGEEAITLYKRLESTEKFSLIEVQLLTGKTHQIRIHLSSIGHPIIGDLKYGDKEINTMCKQEFRLNYQYLHAYKLKISGISGRLSYLNDKEFMAPLPDDKIKITTQIFGK